MQILSLFDGMSCGAITFNGLGIPIDRYVAYEIDKYAIKTATHNFPYIEECGDIFKGDFTQYEGFDWLIGGSVCTFWSIAQTKHRETTASGLGWELFSQYVRALHEAKPKFFLYENNKSMSPAIRAQISETFGFEPICINSALVSAQTRWRLYWVGYRNEDGTYSQVPIKQPEDRGILLRDILETTTSEKGYALGELKPLSEKEMAYMLRETRDGRNHFDFDHFHDAGRAKSSCVTANTYRGVPYNVLAEPVRIGTIEHTAKNRDFDSQQYRVYSPDSKSVTQCGNGGGLGAKTGLYMTPVSPADGDNFRYPVYEVRGGKLIFNGEPFPVKMKDGIYMIRKLTATECKRLQTVPDEYEFPVSDTQAYKMLGNGWTVEVIKHLIQSTYNFAKEEHI